MAEPGYFKLRHGISRNAVMLRLPPAARWAFITLLDVAKEHGGVFDSDEQLVESMGTNAQWLSLLRQTACDPEGTLLEGPDGLTVHEWPEHQDDLPTIISKRNAKAGRLGGLHSKNQPRQGGRFAPKPSTVATDQPPSPLRAGGPSDHRADQGELSSIPPSGTERHRAYGVRDGDGDRDRDLSVDVLTTPLGIEPNASLGFVESLDGVHSWATKHGYQDANKDEVDLLLAGADLTSSRAIKALEKAERLGKAPGNRKLETLIKYILSNQNGTELGSIAGRT